MCTTQLRVGKGSETPIWKRCLLALGCKLRVLGSLRVFRKNTPIILAVKIHILGCKQRKKGDHTVECFALYFCCPYKNYYYF